MRDFCFLQSSFNMLTAVFLWASLVGLTVHGKATASECRKRSKSASCGESGVVKPDLLTRTRTAMFVYQIFAFSRFLFKLNGTISYHIHLAIQY